MAERQSMALRGKHCYDNGRRMKTEKIGFTLIELLIVIVIIAILASAMIPIFNVRRLDAKISKALADLESIKTAAHTLHADTKTWPPLDSTNRNNDGKGLVYNDAANPISNWNGPYLDKWSNDPWGRPYVIYPFGQNPTHLYAKSFGRTIYLIDECYDCLDPIPIYQAFNITPDISIYVSPNPPPSDPPPSPRLCDDVLLMITRDVSQ